MNCILTLFLVIGAVACGSSRVQAADEFEFFSTSIRQVAFPYNNYTLSLYGFTIVQATNLHGIITNAFVEGKGLTISGFTADVPTSVTTIATLLIAGTKVTNSTITISSILPPHMYLRIVETHATQNEIQSVFLLNTVFLETNVTLLIEAVTAVWTYMMDGGGYVVQYELSDVTGVGMARLSALRILHVKAMQAAGIFSTLRASAQPFSMGTYSVLSVDHCVCTTCSTSLVVYMALTMAANSVFRLSKSQQVLPPAENILVPYLLSAVGSTEMSIFSVYIIDTCTSESPLFFFTDGIFTEGRPTISFLRLRAPSTGLTNIIIPAASNATVYGSATINGIFLTTPEEYLNHGLNVTIPLSLSGHVLNSLTLECAKATSLLASTVDTADGTSEVKPCVAVCSSTTYAPSCTRVWDPIEWYAAGTYPCPVRNCLTCDMSHATYCTSCEPNYWLFTTQVCSETPLPCESIANCTACTNAKVCSACEVGYYLDSNWTCTVCPEECTACTSAIECTNCTDPNTLDAFGKCKPCGVSDCINCTELNVCHDCRPDFSLAASGTKCAACLIEDCIHCELPMKCATCKTGYDVTIEFKCQQCSPTLCEECGQFGMCTRCIPAYRPTEQYGICIRCSIPGCLTCGSEEVCVFCMGTMVPAIDGASCHQCSPHNCSRCVSPGDGTLCAECESGFQLQSNGECEKIPFFQWWVILLIALGGVIVLAIIFSSIAMIVIILCRSEPPEHKNPLPPNPLSRVRQEAFVTPHDVVEPYVQHYPQLTKEAVDEYGGGHRNWRLN